ncbi:MnhB domain-containing protein [Bengtsoniella intestinalis]|uniref:hydrogen gas-evolving membrane-bound hydrogenase subunit E n=1 Tax=Bengtsoniella intestinalis TaxID=3073143 RepID=UPI00391F9D31
MKYKIRQSLNRFVEGDFTLQYTKPQASPRRDPRHEEASTEVRFIQWHDKKAIGLFSGFYNVASTAICLGVIFILLVTVSFLPAFGDADAPINNEVSTRYIEQGLAETGATNIVSGMILDYRAFDTLGESAVLFLASVSVFMLMKNTESHPEHGTVHHRYRKVQRDPIVKNIAKYIIPFLLVFGIYIVLNGHLSPGGGFAGGSVMGASLILYSSAYGYESIRKVITQKRVRRVTFCSLSFYAVAKSYSFYTGAHHLETGIPLGNAGDILSSGLILPLNICVGLIVTCTMYSFYSLFTKGDI